MNTIAYFISAAAVIVGVACWLDPYTARLVAAILRAHAAATAAARKERSKVWRRCSRAAAIKEPDPKVRAA